MAAGAKYSSKGHCAYGDQIFWNFVPVKNCLPVLH